MLKGAAASLGLKRLEAAAGGIEKAANEGGLEKAASDIADLQRLQRRSAAALHEAWEALLHAESAAPAQVTSAAKR
jgi:HPt (histidine-containing phosphotransfer) domain-containing protein